METANDIQSRMLTNVDDDYDKTVGSFIYDALKPAAIEFSLQQGKIETVQRKLDINNLSGDELTRFVYTRTGITRKPATKATTNVIISGSVGATIAIGDLVSTDTINFVATEAGTIGAGGTMTVPVECQQYGSIGNVPANTITIFPSSISGLVDVYNASTVTNGYDEETDDELKERYFNKLQRPGKAGNVYHYEEWAKSVTGVGDARIVPTWNGPLTVKAIIIDSNKQPASAELIQDVTDYIESEMPFGAILTVVSATGVKINVSATLTLAIGYEEANVIATIEENIMKYLQEIAFNSTFVSYAKIGSIIIDSEGVIDYESLTVNNGTTNISIDNDEVAILGGVNK